MKIEIQRLSNQYIVRELSPEDVEVIYELCAGNKQFYRFHPPFVTKESILCDLKDLPPGKTLEDKLFVGFFDNDVLIAVMDLILSYPDKGNTQSEHFWSKNMFVKTGEAFPTDSSVLLPMERVL